MNCRRRVYHIRPLEKKSSRMNEWNEWMNRWIEANHANWYQMNNQTCLNCFYLVVRSNAWQRTWKTNSINIVINRMNHNELLCLFSFRFFSSPIHIGCCCCAAAAAAVVLLEPECDCFWSVVSWRIRILFDFMV